MSSRTLVYKLMVAGPVVLTLGIGVQARTNYEEFEPLGYLKPENDAVTSYVPVVRKTDSIIKGETTEADLPLCRQVAQMWVEDSKTGQIKPLKPAFYEDTMVDGAKGEITKAASRVIDILNLAARREMERKDTKNGVADTLLAMDVARVLKYTDFTTLAMYGSQHRRGISIIRGHVGDLNTEQKAAVLAELPKLSTTPTDLQRMAVRARALYVSYKRRQGEKPLSIEDSQEFVSMQSVFTSEADAEQKVKMLRSSVVATNDDSPLAVSTLRLGYLAEIETKRVANLLAEQIKGSKR